MIYFGTSGFSYDDWVEPFYPPGLPKQEWLSYYAREFNTCEINSTYYAIPRPSLFASMIKRTGPGFSFVIKAFQGLTHERTDNGAVFGSFRQSLQPLIEASRLGGILAQFPYSFKPVKQDRDYLSLVREKLAGLPLVVEFRNSGWLTGETFDWLTQHDVAFCCVDEPRLPGLIPPVARVTAKTGYVRFHGRNAEKWWRHQHAYERYDYTYSVEELREWAPKIKQIDQAAEKTFVFANNHWRGQAVDTIRTLKTMLD